MKKCIILGAGFSKAIAKLPLTKELFNRFDEISKEHNLYANSNIATSYVEIKNFLDYLFNHYLKKRLQSINNKTEVISHNYFENFEAICSYIDLNLANEVRAITKTNNESSDFSGDPLFINRNLNYLAEIKRLIMNYLKLTLYNYNADTNLLDKFNNIFLANTNAIITFNYDLILEKYLYEKKKWYPKDGYGFLINNFPELSDDVKNNKSSFPILKLHGSLNWCVCSNNKFTLEWIDNNNEVHFPNYFKNDPRNNFKYVGKSLTNGWIMPTWIKTFSFKELIEVWKLASKKLNQADELIFIGYSLPVSDSAVHILLSSFNSYNKKIIIIDSNAHQLKGKYSLIFPKNNIKITPIPFEKYLLNYYS